MLGTWYDTTCIKIETTAPGVKRLWFRFDALTAFTFTPGQFMTFDLPISDKRTKRWRSYSIASSPDGGNVLEFVIVHLKGGLGSTYLCKDLQVGDSLRMRGPLGNFTLPQDYNQLPEKLCFICTGTGLAPFRSMLWHLQAELAPANIPPITLIFGTRYLKNVLYQAEMEAFEKTLPHFQYHIALSRQATGTFKGTSGYVHQLYQKLFAEDAATSALTTFYLCGWRNMIDEARQNLAEMGYPKEQIIYELYG